MNKFQIASTVLLLAVTVVAGAKFGFSQKTEEPRVFILPVKDYRALKPTDAAYRKIDNDAKKALTIKVEPITSKQAKPPSGDKHDYMSQAPYFWRNPNTPTGLPYVRRDGERNPEIKQYPDHALMDTMVQTVERLALGYFVTGKNEHAARAGEILRMWFIDPSTRMNPNLEYAQSIPGLNTGRGIGLIETRGLTRVVDSVGLLAGSSAWTKSDQAGVEVWFSKFLSWMQESKNGKDESRSKNNHGTFYDVQIASYALFVGNRDLAKTTLENAKQKRISTQVEKDGRQPLELARTKSWDYSVMNLEGLVDLAELAEHVGIDLWNFQTADGRGIRKAILYLEPFAHDPSKWPYKQIVPINASKLNEITQSASDIYKDPEFQSASSDKHVSKNLLRN
jgi:hypothetical protein